MAHLVDMATALRPRPPSPVQELRDNRFTSRGLRLLLKRDDLIHSTVPWDSSALGPVDLYPPGNKWRKLVPNLSAARAAGHTTVLTFGGAYSNHLRATAAAGRLLGLATIGVVRGHELADRPLNPSLARCAADGMRLHFVDRATYRRRGEPEFLDALQERLGPFFAVPEGGSNAAAVHGCALLGEEIRGTADVVGVACGTGGTLAGLAAGLGEGTPALGFPVLRDESPEHFLAAGVRGLQTAAFGGPRGNWSLESRFHGGGYARRSPALLAFAEDFERRHGLRLEADYVAKALWGLVTLAEEGAFPAGTRVMAVVTGRPEPWDAPAGERGAAAAGSPHSSSR
ncbi:1-aminocyclopropane-1-carboxylate deaminase/D-cysteine desulfhydrase [Streptomyces sp. NPDC059740]|uniref:1-aminocyclopropane-1-carboxylate deaminase/D-cysteine desulfhydrase n=1 Tax=Streptomyces sp. NPDC059740 TaxID=3346926 RepID=UPI003650B243